MKEKFVPHGPLLVVPMNKFLTRREHKRFLQGKKGDKLSILSMQPRIHNNKLIGYCSVSRIELPITKDIILNQDYYWGNNFARHAKPILVKKNGWLKRLKRQYDKR